MKSAKIILASVLVLALLAGAAGCTANTEDDEKFTVVTTIFPIYDWARSIIKDDPHVELDILLDNGVDLHSYQPSADDIITISSCDIFIYVGGESDAWVDDALREAINENMIVLDLLDVIGEKAMEEAELEGMEREEEEEETYDEHIWLSLDNASVCCRAIADAMKEADPTHADKYEANAAEYTNALTALDGEYRVLCDGAENKVLLFADRFPFAYMTNDYGLTPYAAFSGCSAESEASFETITFLAGKIKEYSLENVITIEGSDTRIAETVISAAKSDGYTGSVTVLSLDSMQSTTRSDIDAGVTYLSVMEKNLETLTAVLGTGR